MHSVIKNPPFVDGNERTALAAAALFLRLNGHKLAAGHQEAEDFVVRCAEGDVPLSEMATWLRERAKRLR